MSDPDWPDAFSFDLAVDRSDGPASVSFLTRDGLDSKTEPRESELALVDAVDADGRSVLVPDANYGVVGVALACSGDTGPVTMTETSARAVTCCRTNVERNGVPDVDVELVPWEPAGGRDYDVLAFAPTEYDPTVVNYKRLLRTLATVVDGGTCYVAVPSATDSAGYVELLEDHCTDVTRVGTDDDVDVYRAVRPSEFDPDDPVDEREFRSTVGEYTCRFRTQPGLFSWEGVDDGTRLLLRNVSVPDGARALDLSCGYGAVGAFVGARTDCELYATDDDVLATSFARRNYRLNGVSPVAVETADCLDAFAEQTFDVVVSNPPTHAGNGVTMKLFDGVREVLDDDGEFWLVYNEVMTYDRLLRESFGFDVDVVAARDSFEVARATPS